MPISVLKVFRSRNSFMLRVYERILCSHVPDLRHEH